MTHLEIRTHPEGGETVHGDEVPKGSVELVIGDPEEYPEGDQPRDHDEVFGDE